MEREKDVAGGYLKQGRRRGTANEARRWLTRFQPFLLLVAA